MNTKYKIIISIVVVVTAFAAGRYSAPKIPDSHIVTTTVVDDKKEVKQDDHKKTVIVKTPDGTTTTTITDEDVVTTQDVKDTDQHVDATITAPKTSKLNVSALVGTPFTGPNPFQPVYGVSVTKEVLGPISVGVWALTNSTVGVSLGWDF